MPFSFYSFPHDIQVYFLKKKSGEGFEGGESEKKIYQQEPWRVNTQGPQAAIWKMRLTGDLETPHHHHH